MEYAVIRSGGKQYKVAIGDTLRLEHLAGEKDQKITINEVLMYLSDEKAYIGSPVVDGMSVTAVILEHLKGKKIRVAKFKAKSRYRRVTGHRQSLTLVRIESINGKSASKPS